MFIFSFIFFVIFYATFLSNKLLKKEVFGIDDILLLIMNSFFFYGIGYFTLDQHEAGKELLGLFTVGNALVHFIAAVVIFKQSQSDRNVFFLFAGLVLVFITIAIPVQLDGNWVTLLWTGEAALMFWIGRTKEFSIYEKLSYPLILLAFVSLLSDWNVFYGRNMSSDADAMIIPIFNIQFLTSLLFIFGIGLVFYLYTNKKYPVPSLPKQFNDIIKYSIPAILLVAVYFAFHHEIANYWNQLFIQSAIEINNGEQEAVKVIRNQDLQSFKIIWFASNMFQSIFFQVMGYE